MIHLSEIASVYSGKNGACCCGCSGIYRYASAHKDARPSYIDPASNEWVSDRMVKLVVNKLNALGYKDEGYGYVGVDHESRVGPTGRLYVAYKVGAS